MISRSFSFWITIRVSTTSLILSIPLSAFLDLLGPSNLNGLVTTPTVSIPISLAISATTGAAPVPVPPPIPQVTNTISAPSRAAARSSLLSSAAFSPTSGLAPAPSPFVSFSPICIQVGAVQEISCCLSVLTLINSTPATPSLIILSTALFPAPPTPTTIILQAPDSLSSFISNKASSSYTYYIVI